MCIHVTTGFARFLTCSTAYTTGLTKTAKWQKTGKKSSQNTVKKCPNGQKRVEKVSEEGKFEVRM